MTKNIAIIPAKGSSERLKGKNLTLLGGKSLLEHSINYAKLNPDVIDRIVVSTDSEEIKTLALRLQVQVIDRPSELASSTASTISVLKHVLETLGEDFQNVILLQPTNPFRPNDLLKEAYTKFCHGRFSSLVTVTPNFQKLGKVIGDRYKPFNYYPGQRSQDLEPLYYENGLLYIINSDFVRKGILMNDETFPFIVDHPFASVDIDTQEELEYAEFIYKKYF